MPKVKVAVGHGVQPDGRQDPGAVGGGWSEQSAGDVIVAAVGRHLDGVDGLEVDTSEANADDPNFYGTTKAANAEGVDLLVTIHHDSATAPDGTFAYHYPGSSSGERIARAIVEAAAAAGFPTRPAWLPDRTGWTDPVGPRNLYVLRETRMPATLVEAGPIGSSLLDTVAELEAFARAVAEGIAAYFGKSLPAPRREIDELDPSPWAASAWERMLELGVLSDGSRPRATVTDERYAVFTDRLVRVLAGMIAERDTSIALLRAELDGLEAPPPPFTVDDVVAEIAARLERDG